MRPATAPERALHSRAHERRASAYAPYSEIDVGAAVATDDGRIFCGANVENASYGLTICAERAAVAVAVAAGVRRITAVAVAGPSASFAPCGACRQVLAEFCDPEAPITFMWQGALVSAPLDELLPEAFTPEQAGKLSAAPRRGRTATVTVVHDEPIDPQGTAEGSDAWPSGFRSGVVGLAGRPNVGKSTLTNALCGGHVSIVSDKPQTTRRRTAAVANGDGWQITLLDLPGFQRPRDRLTERMQSAVDETLADVDAVVFVLDGSERIGQGDRFIAQRVFSARTPVIIALNKVDRLTPVQIGQAIETASELGPFRSLHPISALAADGVDALRDELVGLLPLGPPLYGRDTQSGDPLRLRMAELVREQALQRTREEIPHSVAVVIEEFTAATRRRAAEIDATLIVETDSQKRILVGKGGSMIGAIGSSARAGIEELLGTRAVLRLTVKVRRDWRNDASLLDRFGP